MATELTPEVLAELRQQLEAKRARLRAALGMEPAPNHNREKSRGVRRVPANVSPKAMVFEVPSVISAMRVVPMGVNMS